ncbi:MULTISPECIES: colicin-like pore-forming protein [Serratia]|uniref:colicin-like pore-forming protein n=1 Tax=Serratia TaxID=613 RepID=UPI0027463C6A|nr:colicin-like pore-forming protein [Serratia marcescens]MDP8622959.1 colicin-like pore-forming protein [Serratia marcescens]
MLYYAPHKQELLSFIDDEQQARYITNTVYKYSLIQIIFKEINMSGGDGKDSRGPTGGVKGGPTGIGGGGKGTGSGDVPAIGSGKGDFKVAFQRHEGGWVDSYNAAGQLIGSTRVGYGTDGKGNDSGSPSGESGFNGLPGHPNIADAGQLSGDNSDKHNYHVRDGGSVYSVLVDKDGNIKHVSKIKSPPKNEHDTRLSGNDDAGKQFARNQVQAYLNEKKQAEAKAAAEAKAKDDAEAAAKRRAEEEAKRKQAEWDEQHKEEAAQRQINEAQQRINQAQQDKNNAEQRAGQHDGTANNIQNEQNAIRQEQQRLNDEFTKLLKTGAMSDTSSARYQVAMQLHRQSEQEKQKADAKQGDIDRERNAANQARNEANQAQQRVEQAQREKAGAEARLNTLRAERQAQEAAEAKRKADAEAKAAAEAKAKADAEAARVRDEKDALMKTSELVAAAGEKVGEHLGDKYKAVAKQIADDIKNFQGKKLRSFDDAMASLNKITLNPAMKINKADKEAIVNAWKHVNATDTANKLGNLARAFKVADVALKVEKVREKSIEGYETGNWKPLMLEVESWVLSGVATAAALGLLGLILSAVPITGLPLTALTILGIITISYLSSLIDDKIAEKINNEIIPPAH